MFYDGRHVTGQYFHFRGPGVTSQAEDSQPNLHKLDDLPAPQNSLLNFYKHAMDSTPTPLQINFVADFERQFKSNERRGFR
jgi:hypothetical protein